MSQPTLSSVHVDALLTDVSVAHLQSETNFIADKVFPSVGSQKKSNKYRIYTADDLRRNELKRLGPGAESFESGYTLSSATYDCDVWALGHFVDEQTAANYDSPGDAEEDAAKILMHKAMIARELQFVTDFFSTSIWTTDKTVSTQWNDGASNPKEDVNVGKETVLTSTGIEPNTLVLGYQVFNRLCDHPLIREQFKYTSASSINEAMLANFFGLDRILVSKASYVSSAEGASSDTNALIAGKHALLCYSAPAPGIMAPSAGYTFVWSGLNGLNDLGVSMLRFDMPWRHGVKIEAQLAYDMKVVSADLGYFFSSVVA